MDLQLDGKVAVVTSAGKGIGLAITRALADEGAHVVAGSQPGTTDALDGLERATGIALDLSDPDAPARSPTRTSRRHCSSTSSSPYARLGPRWRT